MLPPKTTDLELQEQEALGRLRSEALESQLGQENRLSKENVSIIENHFTTDEATTECTGFKATSKYDLSNLLIKIELQLLIQDC